MLNFDFLEKRLGIVSPPYFVHDFLRKLSLLFYSPVLLTGQISLSDCLYFLMYWAICVLQLFVFLVVMS